MKSINKMTLYLMPVAIALNLVASQIVFALKLPIWLDCIGVVLVAVLAGWIPASIVGIVTGLLVLITNPANIFYLPIFVVTAIVADLLAKYGGYATVLRSIGSGIINGLIAGGTGAIITIMVFGGLSPSGTSIIAGALQQIGAPVWLAALSASIAGDITDKVVTALMIFFIVAALPARTLVKFPRGERQMELMRKKPSHSPA